MIHNFFWDHDLRYFISSNVSYFLLKGLTRKKKTLSVRGLQGCLSDIIISLLAAVKNYFCKQITSHAWRETLHNFCMCLILSFIRLAWHNLVCIEIFVVLLSIFYTDLFKQYIFKNTQKKDNRRLHPAVAELQMVK